MKCIHLQVTLSSNFVTVVVKQVPVLVAFKECTIPLIAPALHELNSERALELFHTRTVVWLCTEHLPLNGSYLN